MEIVIKIDEEKYKAIIEMYGTFPKEMKDWGVEAIKNGKPLPKAHGGLIDYEYVMNAIDDWINKEEYRYTNATDYLRKRIANAPTIIDGSDNK